MTRDKITKMFSSNVFYIVFSIIAAIFLWIYVVFLRSGTMSMDISNVPVVVTGQEELEDKGLIATSISRDTIDLTIGGSANVVARIPTNEVTVSIDLSDITDSGSSVGIYQLAYTVNYPDNINTSSLSVESASVDYITVKVEKFVSKQIPVKVSYDATVPEGYQVQPIEIDQETIMVSGPESVISQISYAQIDIAMDEITDTYVADLPYIYMSDSGEQIDGELVTSNHETIHVVIPVIMIKEVKLVVDFTGTNSATEDNTRYTVYPETIQISGSPSRVKDLEQISVTTIDLTDFESNFEGEFDIVLPDEIQNLSEEKTAQVTVTISGLSTRNVTATNFETQNLTEGYTADILTDSLDLVIRGKSSDIAGIDSSDIVVTADLSSLRNATGTYTVPAIITVGKDKVDAVGNYTVTVTITQS